jgi:hypothetical protein
MFAVVWPTMKYECKRVFLQGNRMICTLPLKRTQGLPAHESLLQMLENNRTDSFGEDVAELVRCRNFYEFDISGFELFAEPVVA